MNAPSKEQLTTWATIAGAVIASWTGIEARLDKLESRLDATIERQAQITQAYLIGLQSQIKSGQ